MKSVKMKIKNCGQTIKYKNKDKQRGTKVREEKTKAFTPIYGMPGH